MTKRAMPPGLLCPAQNYLEIGHWAEDEHWARDCCLDWQRAMELSVVAVACPELLEGTAALVENSRVAEVEEGQKAMHSSAGHLAQSAEKAAEMSGE